MAVHPLVANPLLASGTVNPILSLVDPLPTEDHLPSRLVTSTIVSRAMAPIPTTLDSLGPRALTYTTSRPVDVGTTIGIVAGIFVAIVVIMCLLSAKARSTRMRRFEEARYYAQSSAWQQQQREKQPDHDLENPPPPAYPATAYFHEPVRGNGQDEERVSHWHGQRYGHRHSHYGS